MSNIASRQCQTKLLQHSKKEKKTAKKVCRCSPVPMSKKSTSPKAILRRSPKIKKVINNIKTMCGDKTALETGKELNIKDSNQSVIYVGTYPRQTYPIIDLTKSDTSLDETYSHQKFPDHEKVTSEHNKKRVLKGTAKPRTCKSVSSVSSAKKGCLPSNHLSGTGSSVLLNQDYDKLVKKFEIIDVPPDYPAFEFGNDSCVTTDGFHEVAEMVLDMEEEYANKDVGFIQGDFLHNDTDIEKIIKVYLPQGPSSCI